MLNTFIVRIVSVYASRPTREERIIIVKYRVFPFVSAFSRFPHFVATHTWACWIQISYVCLSRPLAIIDNLAFFGLFCFFFTS